MAKEVASEELSEEVNQELLLLPEDDAIREDFSLALIFMMVM